MCASIALPRFAWLTRSGLIAALLLWPSAAPAHADPAYPAPSELSRARAAVTTGEQQVQALDAALLAASGRLTASQEQLQTAVENYAQAKISLDERNRQVEVAQAQEGLAAAQASKLQSAVGRLAVGTYFSGAQFGGLEVLFAARTPQELAESAASYHIASTVLDRGFSQARTATATAAAAQQQTRMALAQQSAATALVAAEQAKVQAQVSAASAVSAEVAAARSASLTKLAALRKTSVALEEAREQGLRIEAERAAAARAAAQAAQTRAAEQAAAAKAERLAQAQARPSPDPRPRTEPAPRPAPRPAPKPQPRPDPPATGSGSGATALAWAKTQLGKDYEWAADGPDTYDCSGLTLRAWERAGVYLPHSSRAQYQVTSHIPLAELRPGDLVFYATNTRDPQTIHHVALYYGNQQILEAPFTGAQVRISSIYHSGLLPLGGRP